VVLVSEANSFSRCAYVHALNRATTPPHPHSRLQERHQLELEAWANSCQSHFAYTHGVAFADAREAFERLVLEFELQGRDADLPGLVEVPIALAPPVAPT
jgi:hypothetical protein